MKKKILFQLPFINSDKILNFLFNIYFNNKDNIFYKAKNLNLNFLYFIKNKRKVNLNNFDNYWFNNVMYKIFFNNKSLSNKNINEFNDSTIFFNKNNDKKGYNNSKIISKDKIFEKKLISLKTFPSLLLDNYVNVKKQANAINLKNLQLYDDKKYIENFILSKDNILNNIYQKIINIIIYLIIILSK